MTLHLRPATESDIDFLLALRDKTMRQYLQEAGMATSREEYEKRIRFEFSSAQIMEFDGTPMGLFKVRYDAKQNCWHIIQIQIDPHYQGLRIGSRLIGDVISKAWETGATVKLSVIRTNPAKRLYQRLGFKVVGNRGAELLMALCTDELHEIGC